ncbi:MAG: helix-turn-helix transcriptional regulator [Clostridia bacterium]|nr:helix-turn-helix transcriptional regulator [Clostridia bacterium]MBP3579726.1 helix-turn-helix transcriptional regulator [Clostridia bacterium]
METIGKQIATLRKERGIKQEQLAAFVGVSTQAVSKWENGGVPDTELLPKIADFFSVSIDSLFGRNITEYGDLRTAVSLNIANLPREERLKKVFSLCWDMERSLFGRAPDDGTFEDYEKVIDKNEQRYSRHLSDFGITLMGIANKLKYFCVIPEMESNIDALFENIDYLQFFQFLSDKDIFNVLVFLHKRDTTKAFTENLIAKNFNLTQDKAVEVVGILEKYNLVYKTEIELDDEIKTVYNFKPKPSFVSLLIFAKEMIKPPTNYSYFSMERTKPYLY